MTTFLKTVLTIGVILLFAGGSSAQTKRTAAKSAPDAEFKALIDGYYKAWTIPEGLGAQVPDNAAKSYATDAGLVFYDLAPMQYHGWAEYKAGVIKTFIDVMSNSRFVPNDDLKVTRRGTVAWTTVTFQISAKLEAGGSLEFDGRHTAIWERRGEKWLIVHEHLSAPLPG